MEDFGSVAEKARVYRNQVVENMPETFEKFSKKGLEKHGIYKAVEETPKILYSYAEKYFDEQGKDTRSQMVIQFLDISEESKKFLRELLGFRTFLVADYDGINDKEFFENFEENLTKFDKLLEELENFF